MSTLARRLRTYAPAVERRAPLALLFALVSLSPACGGAPPPEPASSDPANGDPTNGDPARSGGGGEPTSDSRASSATGPDAPCASLADFGACRASGRCVWEVACRDPVSECELLWPEPVFDEGDPCERLRPGCAWSTSARRCVPFVAVPACPSTLAEASALAVSCDHSGQLALECHYGTTHCRCERTAYCGGAPPPPELEHPAAVFACIPPIDARGCPTSPIRDGARCSADPQVYCETCRTSAQCVNGRWRVAQLPPRP